jgi:DNA gyrase subunit A
MKVYDLPSLGRHSRGRAIVNLLDLQGDSIRSLFRVRDFAHGHVVMVTKNGVIKKTELEAYSRPRAGGIIAIRIDDDDELVGVRHTVEGQQVVIATRGGFAIRFPESDVRPTGRATRGVRAITLREGDLVVDFAVVHDDTSLLTVCERGYGKRTDPGEYRLQKRGGMGVINIRTNERNGPVVAMREVHDDESLILSTQKGMIVRIPVADIRVIGRGTQGVRLMSLSEDHLIVAIARAPAEDADDGRNGEGAARVSEADHEPFDEPAGADEEE